MTEGIFFTRFGIAAIAPYLLVILEVALALIIGCGFIAIGAGGGAWILGGIVAGAIGFITYRSHYDSQAKPNRNARKLGQLLIGLAIGFSIQNSNLLPLSSQLPVLALIVGFLLTSGSLIGYLYSRLEKIDLLTGVLATVPGNIGVMASIAADYSKNASLVSLVQLLRFTAIIFIVPLIANVSNPTDINATIYALIKDLSFLNVTYLLLLVLVLSITVFATYLGNQFKIPVAAFFCSILVGISFNGMLNFLPVTYLDFNLPPLLKVVGQILLGTTIGEYWGINPKLEKWTIARAAVPVTLTFLAGFLAAAIARLLTDWDWLTCLLVAAPGGSPEMIWIALALNHNVEIVAAGHLIRLLLLNLSLPILVSLVTRLETRLTPQLAIEPATNPAITAHAGSTPSSTDANSEKASLRVTR